VIGLLANRAPMDDEGKMALAVLRARAIELEARAKAERPWAIVGLAFSLLGVAGALLLIYVGLKLIGAF
jgi:hypothetical protein